MTLRTQITEDIVRRDSAFRNVTDAIGPVPSRRPEPVDQRFPSLIRTITYQLLATSSAQTIHRRVIDACDGTVSVESVLRAGTEGLRVAGLSRAKAGAMVDVATRVADGGIALHTHGRRSDEHIIAEVTAARGVGPWTVQMYLMHTLGRRDVWPVGDFGVRHGWSLLHGLDKMVTERDLRAHGEIFLGVRSDVAWYCWQAVHLHRANQ